MARIKGAKRWNVILVQGWLSLFAMPQVMSDLMMQIIEVLYHSPRFTDNAKHLSLIHIYQNVGRRLFVDTGALQVCFIGRE